MISAAIASPPLSCATPSIRLHQPCRCPRFSSLRPLKSFKIKRRNERAICRAELSQDAPFALAIGACILNSLIFPASDGADDQESGIDAVDARFAAMGIISFIPYFNWMSWVFAWLDTNKRRYLVYSIVYLAPYLKTNLSLSPEESWLPIASIVFCIVHIQLEAGIRNGDFQSFQLFGESLKLLSEKKEKKDAHGSHSPPRKVVSIYGV